MKKLKVLSLCIMVLMLCGCRMKYEYNMSIKSDKSMDFSIVTAMDNELIDGMLSMESEKESYTDEERWQMLEESINEENEDSKPEDFGFTVSKYEEGEFKGYKYSKKIANIDDISGETANFDLSDFANISDSVVFVKNKDKYKASFVMSNEEQSSSTQGYDIGIDMMFTVTLPNKPISHNATSVSEDGKTLTWNLLDSESQNIEFEFQFKNNMILYIGIGVGALLLIVIIAAVILGSKKKNNGNTIPTQKEEVVEENKPNFLEPKESLIEQPKPIEAVTQSIVEQQPIQSEINKPVWTDTPVQPIVEPQMVQPQPVVEPQMVQPQPVVEPQMVQSQPVVEPQNNQSQSLPSVDDILNIANANNPNNN